MSKAIEGARILARELKERAYAVGRRSPVVRSVLSRFRRIRAAALNRPTLVEDELGYLLAFLRGRGCTFHSCSEVGANPAPLRVAFRYDVHVRDLAACHAFIETHRSQNVPATFFFMSDYSDFERSYARQFGELAQNIAKPLEIGLHDSTVDAYLINARFGGDRGRYRAWLNSSEAVEWLIWLAKSEDRFEDLNRHVLTDFAARVQRMKERFGRVTTVAGHGGELVRVFHDKSRKVYPEADRVAHALMAKSWMTAERVAAAGLDACVDNFGSGGARWKQVSDGGGQILDMAKKIERHTRQRRMAMQLLLHPYTWEGTNRDGELSRLLPEK
jgi:hypothetical protein